MKYFLKEVLDLFKWSCVAFTLAFMMARYYGLNTNIVWS